MAMSHTGHNHPSTPAARKACRDSSGNPRVTRIESDGFQVGTARITSRVARPAGLHLTAPAPGLVIRPDSSCVQAELHVDAHGGKCACGWEANK